MSVVPYYGTEERERVVLHRRKALEGVEEWQLKTRHEKGLEVCGNTTHQSDVPH